jgi:hypothetical protein
VYTGVAIGHEANELITAKKKVREALDTVK